jgi:hypothetical protein
MHIDNGLAPIQLVEHRREPRIPEPGIAVAREQTEAVRVQRIER